jgi:hypothetical protein
MSQIIHFIGLDVHKESISVSIAPADSAEVRHYGRIGGTLDDIDRLLKRLQAAAPGVELRFCYEAGPTDFRLSLLASAATRFRGGRHGPKGALSGAA